MRILLDVGFNNTSIFLSCVVQLCHRFPCASEVEVNKALLLESEFPTFYEHFSIFA